MKLFQIITFFLFFCSGVVFSQKTIKHTVVSGESIYSIAKKYDVSESDIYELNPKSKGALLQLKTVLLIPNKKSKSKSNKEVSSSKNATETHIVESGESLYKIAKKYDISLEKLKELSNKTTGNPNVNIQINKFIRDIKCNIKKTMYLVQRT